MFLYIQKFQSTQFTENTFWGSDRVSDDQVADLGNGWFSGLGQCKGGGHGKQHGQCPHTVNMMVEKRKWTTQQPHRGQARTRWFSFLAYEKREEFSLLLYSLDNHYCKPTFFLITRKWKKQVDCWQGHEGDGSPWTHVLINTHNSSCALSTYFIQTGYIYFHAF